MVNCVIICSLDSGYRLLQFGKSDIPPIKGGSSDLPARKAQEGHNNWTPLF